jgi:hypothetical protein
MMPTGARTSRQRPAVYQESPSEPCTAKEIWELYAHPDPNLKIGLKAFLYEAKVPGILSLLSNYGQAKETVQRLVLDYPLTAEAQRQGLPRIHTIQDFLAAAADTKAAGALAKWMLQLGKLYQFYQSLP